MSYNYDYNPWDDTNQGAANQAPQFSQTPQASGSYTPGDAYNTGTSGYSNPTAQYVAQDVWNSDGQYNSYAAGDQQQAHTDETDQQQQQQQQQEQYQQEPTMPSQQPPGFVSRFLRAHVPLCGTCMDITSPIVDALLKYVNRDLLPSKIFYFFFYSAFGSLFPLMGVYFKQLGMNPSQVGILTGVRPFIEIFSAPFWNSLAERFKISRMILLFSLLSWIVFTYALAHIHPPASACIAFNDTDYVLYTAYSTTNDLSNYDVGPAESGRPEQVGAMEESESTTTTTTSATNEVFMNKMPQAVNKDQILINEENVSDQGKRRRRRRRRKRSYTPLTRPYEQIQRPALRHHENTYSSNDVVGPSSAAFDLDEGYASQLDIDLENDFEDLALARSRRSLAYERGEGDEMLGESEPTDESGAEDESERRAKLRGAGREEESGEDNAEEQNAEEENEVSKQRELPPKHPHPQEANGGSPESSGKNQEPRYELGAGEQASVNKTKRVYKQRHKTPPTHIVGMSPITLEYAVNYNKEKHGQMVTPMFSTIVYKLDDIKSVFFLMLLLISLGEFFSAPAITIADSTTLSCLGPNTDLYGRQRMFGSIGWAITLLMVGMALDNSRAIAGHPCGPHQRERNYHVCFTYFSLLMGCALVAATQFKFSYSAKQERGGGSQELVTKTVDDSTVITTTVDATNTGTNIDDVYASTRPREIFNTAPPVNAPPPGSQQAREKFEFLDKWKSAVFAQSTWELPEWVGVFRQFKNTLHLTYLFITWFLGCGVGLVFTFLFWHLQDVGGTPTLFGICSVINHISEILAYFFSSYFIKRYGHTKVLSVGLGCNVIRFLYVAFLSNPYYALPFELVQGITHAACFAACCSYMSHVSKPELKASTQGVMQGLHNGIGRACGALLGGYMINAIGSRASFCVYGLLSGCVLGGFLYARKKASDEGDVKVIDDGNLGNIGAPQGVPEKVRF